MDGGFLTFVLPLIVDNLLHKKLPWLFSPNMLASLQNEKVTFTWVRWRKRLDRAMQLALGVTMGALVAKAAKFVCSRLFTLLTR